MKFSGSFARKSCAWLLRFCEKELWGRKDGEDYSITPVLCWAIKSFMIKRGFHFLFLRLPYSCYPQYFLQFDIFLWRVLLWNGKLSFIPKHDFSKLVLLETKWFMWFTFSSLSEAYFPKERATHARCCPAGLAACESIFFSLLVTLFI